MAGRIVNLSNLQTFTAVNLLSDPGEIGGPIQIPSCAQITINWTLSDGKLGHNVLYGRYAGGFHGTQAEANSLLTALAGSSQFSAVRAFMASSSTLSAISIRDVNVVNAPIISSTSAGAPGSGAGAALPNEVAAVITERTASTGRANRGRIYVPNWSVDALGTGNVILAATVTALAAWGGTFISAFATQGYTLVIGQRARAAYIGATGTSHPARPAQSQAVTSLEVRDNHWDSQRRRGLK
jgi:hypothetical protein